MLPALNLVISASTEGFARALNEAEDKAQSFTRSVSGGLDRVGDAATRAGRFMLPVSGAIAGIATTMGALAVETVKVGNEIDKAARAAGFAVEPFQEVGFALGQITDLSQGEANNALATLNRRVGQAADGNERYADALDKLGISLEDVQSGAVGSEDVFNALVTGIQGTASAAEAATMASDLLGDRIGGRVGPALREFGGDVDGLRQQLRDMGGVLSDDTVGNAADAADQMERVNRQFRAARMTIGAAMLPVLMRFGDLLEGSIIPAIQTFATRVEGLIEWFDALPEGVQSAAGIIAGALGVGGPVLIAIGAVAKALSALVLAGGPIGLMIAAAGALVWAWSKWGDDIKRIVGDAAEWFQDRFGGIVEVIGIVSRELDTQARAMISLLRSVFRGDLRGVMDAMVTIVGTPLRIIAGMWESDFAAPLRNAVGGAVEWFGDRFGGIIEVVQIVARELGAQAEAIIDLFRAVFNGDLRGIMDAMVGIVTTPLRVIAGLWESDFAAPLRDAVSGVAGWVRAEWQRLMDWFMSLPDRFREFGANIVQGLSDGIRGTWDSATDAVGGLWRRIESRWRSDSETQSPSQVFYRFGWHLIEGLALGIEDGAGRAVDAMRGVAGDVIGAARTMAGAVSGEVGTMVNDVLGAMGQLFQGNKAIAIAQAIVNIAQGITAALARGPLGFADAARIAAQGASALAQIRSASPGSGGSAPGIGGGGGSEPQAIPVQRMVIETQGTGPIPQSSLEGIIEQINEAGRQGYRIDAQFVGAR